MNRTAVVIVLGVYAAMSAVSFCAYGIDKWKARSGRWRIPERTLLTIDALGGWPGGLIAQRVFRHKGNKRQYQKAFWGIVCLHVVLWVAVLAGYVLEARAVGPAVGRD